MRHTLWLFLALILAANPARAVELTWGSGASHLEFSSTTACTLLVRSTEQEPGLASEWRLLWVAGGCPSLQFTLNPNADDPAVGEATEADVQNVAEKRGHTQTVHFTSPDGQQTEEARICLVLPRGSAGKFQVVELVRGDGEGVSGLLRKSQVVTFNGGIAAPLPGAILGASSDHPTATVTVNLKGTGLASPTGLALGGGDESWRVPLEVVDASDTTITATADVPSALPGAYLSLSAENGTTSAALLAGDTVTVTPVVKGNSWLVVPEDPAVVIPKDFAFVYNTVPTSTPHKWRGLFHIMYIRQFVSGVPADSNEHSFGHLWSEDLGIWHRDTQAFIHGAHGADKLHVWAPSIVPNGDKHYMYYTGVDSLHDQRILRVTTALLDTSNTVWSDDRPVVLDVTSPVLIDWMVKKRLSPPAEGAQLRDPYVFPDPDFVGRFLMVYTAMDSLATGTPFAVGLARNSAGSMEQWTSLGRYLATTRPAASVGRLESPHVIPDSVHANPSGAPANAGWRIMFTDAGGLATRTTSLQMVTAASASVHADDLAAASWSAPSTVLSYLSPDTTVSGWVASEQLRAGKMDFLAAQNAYNFDGIHIARMYWNGNDFQLRVPSVVSVDDEHSMVRSTKLALRNFNPGQRQVEFLVELPRGMQVKLMLYDVQGRRTAILLDKRVEPGKTFVKWNGTGTGGERVESGMYFALLSFAGGTRTVSFPMLR